MTITVAMPYWGCPDLVERAVRCVLAQTYRDLMLVVIGDGENPPLRNVRDSRLEVYRLPENRGAYFGLQLVLEASPHKWYGPHAADDTSDPEHYEVLGRRAQAAASEAVIADAVWWGEGRDVVRRSSGYEVGVYTRRRLLAFGGYNPAERIAQDTLLIKLLKITGRLAAEGEPTYHRIKRPGSLTRDPATGLVSPYRAEVKARNRSIYYASKRLRNPRAIRDYRAGLVPAEIRAELDVHVDRLRSRLGTEVAA
jgi:glycosyltransferase involved in cell wall biosynthesis